ncbi:hypothetical protein J2S74_001771 [Evansella vedderi]|uniref:Sin domain-containing protein n=1 Tax=Evansella vedderi TaxID=38282 RepID=A0ABT9ZUL1_9BACI|nr:anti-repressor SinI family protein [Evansella vedderi]MDQ0254396.1 hypothetical protein [Evansella vedderi]
MEESKPVLLDEEWVELIKEALSIGVEPRDIRNFLRKDTTVSEIG